MKKQHFAERLEVGDAVLVRSHAGGFLHERVEHVGLITEMHLTLQESGTRFRRSDGTPLEPDSSSHFQLSEATPEGIKAANDARDRRLISRQLAGLKWERQPLSRLRKVARMVGLIDD